MTIIPCLSTLSLLLSGQRKTCIAKIDLHKLHLSDCHAQLLKRILFFLCCNRVNILTAFSSYLLVLPKVADRSFK